MSRLLVPVTVVTALVFVATPAMAQRLVQAAARADAVAVRQLLNQRVDPNEADTNGTTALHNAVFAGDVATADLLIRAGAKVATANAFGITPVYIAAEQGQHELLRRLLEAGADPNTTDGTGDTLLMAAVRAGDLEPVRLLIERGARVDQADPELGHTALMWAARSDNAALVRLLLEHGAAIEKATRVGPKTAARPPGAGGGSHGVGIVRSGVPPQGEQLPAPGGMTPLLFSARGGSVHAAGGLVGGKAQPHPPGPDRLTPVLVGVTHNQLP